MGDRGAGRDVVLLVESYSPRLSEATVLVEFHSPLACRSPPGRLSRRPVCAGVANCGTVYFWLNSPLVEHHGSTSPRTLEAVVDGGLLRPLQELELPEQQRVRLTIVTLPDETRDRVACDDLAQTIGVIGVADDAPRDLSTNPADSRHPRTRHGHGG
ncbi:MAG: antitoxin family protein [Planctomycetales bacterium]